jgi:hypothetical protein
MFAPAHRLVIPPWKGLEAVRTWPQIRAAMKNGFGLHVRYDDRGNYDYYLQRDGERSPPGFVKQNVARSAHLSFRMGVSMKAADGSHFFKLTTKSGD